MAAGKEARLTLRLVDRVTAPAKTISGALAGLNAATRAFSSATMATTHALSRSGKRLRAASYNATGLSAPLATAGAVAARAVYQYEKAGNKMQAFGLLTEEQRGKLEEFAQALNKDFPFTNKDIIRAAQELFRAGMTYEQAMGMLRGTLQLGLAGDVDVKEAADIATNIMTAMKMPMQTYEQAVESIARVNDALAYAATNSNTDVKLMGDTFRYVAPLAAAAGMELEQVAAVSMELAKAGIKGSEAGVALRSGLVRMAKPTKPMMAAFERLNINIRDFIKYRDTLSADMVVGSMLAEGFDVEEIRTQIEQIVGDKALQGAPARMVAALTDAIVATMGDESVRDQVSSAVTDLVTAGAQQVDLFKLLATLRDKNATLTDIAQIFDVRMGSRLAAILSSDLAGATDKLKSEYRDVGAKMAGLMMQGIVGSTARILAAMENFAIKVADSGVLDTIAGIFDRLGESFNTLAQSNPEMLKLGTYAAIALTAMAPLGLALSGVAAALSLATNPLALAIAGIGYFAATNWDKITLGVESFGLGLKQNLGPNTVRFFEKLKNATRRLLDGFRTGFGLSARDVAVKMQAMGRAVANGVESVLGTLDRLSKTRFATGFMTGLRDALENLRWIGEKLSHTFDTFGVDMQPLMDFLNSDAGQKLGEMAGQLTTYGGALLGAAIAIGMVAGPVRAVGKALIFLSGIKLAWGVLTFLSRLAGIGKKAGQVSALAGAVGALGGSGGKGGKGLPGMLISGALIGGGMYLLHEATKDDPEFGVFYLNPKKFPEANPSSLFDSWRVPRDPGPLTRGGHRRGRVEEAARRRAEEDAELRAIAKVMSEDAERATGKPPRKRYTHPDGRAPLEIDMNRILEKVGSASEAMAEVETRAATAGKNIQSSLSVTAKPEVDTSALSRALALARAVGAYIASLGGSSGTPAASSGSTGSGAMRARASGGPVQKGLTYRVNEKGIETITLGSNGYVTPANKAGGGNVPKVDIHINGATDPMAVARQVSRELDRLFGRSNALAMDGREIA